VRVLWLGSIFFAMSMRVYLTVILLILALGRTAAQRADSLRAAPDTALFKSAFRKQFSARWHQQPHSPFKATVLALSFPGAGQIYNGMAKEGSFFRKYWKVPIVWAGVGTCVAFIDFNTRNYKYFKREYIAAADDDPTTIPTESENPLYLNDGMEYYRKLMDISYMSLLGVYVLQAIDANVDAHLFYYDISNDLSLRWHPSYFVAGSRHHGLGLTLQF
jgi:TM2 domain-containing membrane protein YozV